MTSFRTNVLLFRTKSKIITIKPIVILFLMLYSSFGNAQRFNSYSLHKFMDYSSEYLIKELSAQGLDYYEASPPKQGVTVMYEGGLISYIYKNSNCISVFFVLVDNNHGYELKKAYYSFLEDQGEKQPDGTWLIYSDFRAFRVEYSADPQKPNSQGGIYRIRPL